MGGRIDFPCRTFFGKTIVFDLILFKWQRQQGPIFQSYLTVIAS